MPTLLGKVNPDYLKTFVYPHLGTQRAEVLVGPGFGVDNAIIRIARNRVMAITTDPISLIPSIGPEESAWLSIHNLASDLTTSALSPAYGTLDFNLPPQLKDKEFLRYWSAVEHEFRELGMAIVGGHTGRFVGCDYTIIGGGTLMAVGEEENYISSDMSQAGDHLILTKSAALSSAAILARVYPHAIEDALGVRSLRKAWKLFRNISTVHDARALSSIGIRQNGISAMHDTTEGGVFAAIYEMLTASGVGGIIDAELVPIDEIVRTICELFSIDPYTSLGEGALLASVRPARVNDAIRALKNVGISGTEIGLVTKKTQGLRLRTESGERRLSYPKKDSYWSAYWKGIGLGRK